MAQSLLPILLSLLISLPIYAQTFFHRGRNDGLPSNSVKCFAQDADGYLWVGTTHGICRYDGVHFITFQHGDSLSTTASSMIHCIAFVSDSLLVGTSHGLDILSPLTGVHRQVSAIHHPVSHICTLGHSALIRDISGRLWLWEPGCEVKSIVTEYPVRALWVMDRLHVLLLTPTHLICADSHTFAPYSQIEVAPTDPEWANLYYSQRMQTIIVGGGLGYATQSFCFVNSKLVPSDFPCPSHVKAVTDCQNATWIATDGQGLWRYDDTLQQLTPHNSLINGFAIHALYADREDNLWVGNYRAGMDVCSPRPNVQLHLTVANSRLSQNVVTGLAIHQKLVYAGIDGGGLNIINPANKQITVLNAVNSQLPGDNIISLTSDEHYIWMGIYEHGVCRYDPANHLFRSVDMTGNGCPMSLTHLWQVWNEGPHSLALQGNGNRRWMVDKRTMRLTSQQPVGDNPQSEFVRRVSGLSRFSGVHVYCAVHDPDGLLWLGTDNGLYAISPTEISGPYPVHRISYSHIHIPRTNQVRWLGPGIPEELRLHYNENVFTVTVSTSELIEPQTVNLRYRLQGFDHQWNFLTGERDIQYSALPPGNYQLHLQTTDRDGQWNERAIILPITILPPWWASWWMSVFYILLLAACVPVAVSFVRYRRSVLLKISAYEKLMRQIPGNPMPNQPESSNGPVMSAEDEMLLMKCRQIIIDNLINKELSVDFMADKLCMSHSALYKRIKKITGRSVIDMILDCRIYTALELMQHGGQNLSAIAEKCGFSDIRTFRMAFKKRMGVPPSQYCGTEVSLEAYKSNHVGST